MQFVMNERIVLEQRTFFALAVQHQEAPASYESTTAKNLFYRRVLRSQFRIRKLLILASWSY